MGRLRPGVPRALDLFLGGNAMRTTGGPGARQTIRAAELWLFPLPLVGKLYTLLNSFGMAVSEIGDFHDLRPDQPGLHE
jgi:hypothetical protein